MKNNKVSSFSILFFVVMRTYCKRFLSFFIYHYCLLFHSNRKHMHTHTQLTSVLQKKTQAVSHKISMQTNKQNPTGPIPVNVEKKRSPPPPKRNLENSSLLSLL